MKLSAAAKRFDTTPVKDAFTDVVSCYGQMDLYDDAEREGMTTVRRVLSVAPSIDLPARNTVKIGDDVWLAGRLPAPDFWNGSAIRHKYVIHRADGPALVNTIENELKLVQGLSAYAGAVFVKGLKEIDESSDVSNHVELYFADGEAVLPGQVVRLSRQTYSWFDYNHSDVALYAVRSVHTSTAGFTVAVVEQLDSPNFETVSYAAKVYAPITDTFSSTVSSIKALRLRWQSRFQYLVPAAAKYNEGDDVVMVTKTAVPSVTTGDTITLSDGLRRIEGYYAEGNLWHLHVRRV